MTEIALVQPAPQTTAEYEAVFDRLMAEAESINEQMQRNRIDIERLKAETKVLGEETGRLKAETRTLLAGMGAKV